MKSIIQLLIVCFISAQVSAQLKVNHFIYIQSETKEPFYVMLNGSNHSSSPNGYLILAKLPSGTVNFTVGFARDKYPEQQFETAITNDDLGFSLRLNANKQWELFNLQDFTTIITGQKAVNATNLPKANIKAPKPVTIANTATKPIQTEAVITPATVTKPTSARVVKLSSIVSETGLTEIYVDKGDTVKIFIPNNATVKANAAAKELSTANNPDKNGKNCTFASNEDFINLRAKMAGFTDESDMLVAAAKAFKEKCFSVEQVKNLSYLLISEENKLDFLLFAQKTVYDASNFSSLQALLSKPALIMQFRNALQ
jgi:hypothetical protein